MLLMPHSISTKRLHLPRRVPNWKWGNLTEKKEIWENEWSDLYELQKDVKL